MPPIRRYLRITPYSVLEVRIYLDNPNLASTWLLHPRNPQLLPRVIAAVRPLVLPKLREENARARSKGKGKQKKVVRDVVVEDDFEVSVYLAETSTRHSLLTKQKRFREKLNSNDEDRGMRSNAEKLIQAAAGDEAIRIGDDDESMPPPVTIIREESDEDMLELKDIPVAERVHDEGGSETGLRTRARTRKKRGRESEKAASTFQSNDDEDEEENGSNELFVDYSDNSDTEPPNKRLREANIASHTPQDQDNKKKLAMDTSYDGFSIYGRVLCLVVKKRDTEKDREKAKGKTKPGEEVGAGQTMMEEWIIASTQMGAGDED